MKAQTFDNHTYFPTMGLISVVAVSGDHLGVSYSAPTLYPDASMTLCATWSSIRGRQRDGPLSQVIVRLSGEDWGATPAGGLVLAGGLAVVVAGATLLAASQAVTAVTARPPAGRPRPPL